MSELILFLQAIGLGVVQGLTEFLPVSSSAHLETLPWLLGFQTPGKVFDTSLHLGTVFALILFFYKDFLEIGKAFFSKKDDEETKRNKRFGWGILLGILPAGIIGVLFDHVIETLLGVTTNPSAVYVVIVMLIFFGILLYLSDRFGGGDLKATQMSIPQMFLVGVMQAFALIPGVSRSGVTMTAAMAAGCSRKEAARVSFLLGTPIILAAGIFKLKDLGGLDLSGIMIVYFLLGILSSAITGYFCIKYFLAFLAKQDTKFFMIYRIGFALLLLAGALFLR